jgi:predicted nucleic acid-binding Zn ribbon protein
VSYGVVPQKYVECATRLVGLSDRAEGAHERLRERRPSRGWASEGSRSLAAPREKEPRKGLLQRLSRVAMRVPSLEVMTSRQCLSCGAPITVLARPDKTYCSGRCRTAAHRRRHGRNPRPAVELDTLAAQLEPAIAEATLVASIAFAARTDWRAAAHVLATRWPSRWGRRNQRGRDGEPLDFND